MTKYRGEQLIIQNLLAEHIGEFLTKLRQMYPGITQYDVAREVGCGQTRISSTEIGKYMPTPASIVEHLMGIGAARVRREICDDECPCKRNQELHTADNEGPVHQVSEEGQGETTAG